MKKLKKGFTLIELVVVIAIMAILALIMVPNLVAYVEKAEIAAIKTNLVNLSTAYEMSLFTYTDTNAKNNEMLTQEELLNDTKNLISMYSNIPSEKIIFIEFLDDATNSPSLFYIYENFDFENMTAWPTFMAFTRSGKEVTLEGSKYFTMGIPSGITPPH